MSVASRPEVLRRADGAVAVGAVAAAGLGVALALAGAASANPLLAIAGGLLAAAGAFTILAAGWVDGALLLALVLPLPAIYSSETLRISPALVVTALVVPGWLLRRTLEGGTLSFGALPRRRTALLGAAVLLAAVFAEAYVPALRELVTFGLLFGVLLMAADEVTARPARAHVIAIALAAAAAVSGVCAVLEAGGVLPGRFPREGSPFYRAAFGFTWPNELGQYFAFSLPFTVYARSVARGRLARTLATAAVVSCVLGLAATFSRGSWVTALAATATLGLLGEWRLMLRVWAAGLVAILALDLVSGGALSGRVASALVDQVAAQRLALQYTGLLIFRAHPVVGIGPGNFEVGLERYGPQISWLWDYIGSAHNLYIHMAAETGAIGLIALLAFLGAAFRVLVRSARSAGAAAAAGAMAGADVALRRTLAWSFGTVCVAGMFEWPFAHGLGQLIMLVAGMGCGLAPLTAPRGPATRG